LLLAIGGAYFTGDRLAGRMQSLPASSDLPATPKLTAPVFAAGAFV
jgi:hypothetical protein